MKSLARPVCYLFGSVRFVRFGPVCAFIGGWLVGWLLGCCALLLMAGLVGSQGVWQALRHIHATEGLAGLFKGLSLTWLKGLSAFVALSGHPVVASCGPPCSFMEEHGVCSSTMETYLLDHVVRARHVRVCVCVCVCVCCVCVAA